MSEKVFAYARVSSKEQNLERQLEQLRPLVADLRDIYQDKASGKDFDRTQYQLLINNLRDGDLLVVTSLDRLGRNYTEIIEQWDIITKQKKVDIKVLDMPLLDTSVAINTLDKQFIADLVLQILSYTAQKERENIRTRQRQGIDVMPIVNGKRVSARTQRAIGRPVAEYPEQWAEVYSQWKAGIITANKAMEMLDMKRTTFYKLSKQYENK